MKNSLTELYAKCLMEKGLYDLSKKETGLPKDLKRVSKEIEDCKLYHRSWIKDPLIRKVVSSVVFIRKSPGYLTLTKAAYALGNIGVARPYSVGAVSIGGCVEGLSFGTILIDLLLREDLSLQSYCKSPSTGEINSPFNHFNYGSAWFIPDLNSITVESYESFSKFTPCTVKIK